MADAEKAGTRNSRRLISARSPLRRAERKYAMNFDTEFACMVMPSRSVVIDTEKGGI